MESEPKPWARMRKHGPCMIFDWHLTEAEARAAITAKFQTVAYFPHEAIGGELDGTTGGGVGYKRGELSDGDTVHGGKDAALTYRRGSQKQPKRGQNQRAPAEG